jgi:hypothetical protein
MIFIRNTLLAVILLAGFAGAAHALTFEDIAGKWCGITTNYQFSTDLPLVTFHDGTPTRRFEVTSYDYNDDVITSLVLSAAIRLFTRTSGGRPCPIRVPFVCPPMTM